MAILVGFIVLVGAALVVSFYEDDKQRQQRLIDELSVARAKLAKEKQDRLDDEELARAQALGTQVRDLETGEWRPFERRDLI